MDKEKEQTCDSCSKKKKCIIYKNHKGGKYCALIKCSEYQIKTGSIGRR